MGLLFEIQDWERHVLFFLIGGIWIMGMVGLGDFAMLDLRLTLIWRNM